MDRNSVPAAKKNRPSVSLSARRAWIEIVSNLSTLCSVVVALRKESVDRNDTVQVIVIVMDSRSPQGERG